MTLSTFLVVLNLLCVSIFMLLTEANIFLFVEVVVLTDCGVFVAVEYLEVSLESYLIGDLLLLYVF